jgi:hypothetical protein
VSAPIHSGWADDRFMVAYDAICGILSDHATAEDKLPELKDLLHEIEQADVLLAAIFAARATEPSA